MDIIKFRIFLAFLLSSLVATSCQNSENTQKKEPIFLADREVSLGWVYLKIYADGTFEFVTRGLERKGLIYNGTVTLKNDTLFFNYNDSIPLVGNTALLTKYNVNYISGEYAEILEIKLDKLDR